MKKSLVLAMAMALGVTATAFAANPFSDVPAGHWAYGSVAKLAAAGIVDGYPDGTFQGNETMTRYEMAQIVAKALAKGAIGADDKLVAEFANELDNLGVRVAKLEKNADNVSITGTARVRYLDVKGNTNGHTADLRSRLYLKGAINDGWTYGAMVENTQSLDTNAEENKTSFREANVKGKLGAVKVIAGRWNYTTGEGNVWDDRLDGLQLATTWGKTNLALTYGRPDLEVDYTKPAEANDYVNMFIGTVEHTFGAVTADAAYYHVDTKDSSFAPGKVKENIYTVGLKGKVAKDLTLGGEYLKSSVEDADGNSNGYVFTLSYKGASAAKAGSYGVWAKYYNQAESTYVSHTTDAVLDDLDGFKGFGIGANYTVAKNIVATVEYFKLDSKTSTGDTKTIWTDLTFSF
ncbi:MAG: S-layer homology domain-containing protein [Acidaminococcaceae bacterium]